MSSGPPVTRSSTRKRAGSTSSFSEAIDDVSTYTDKAADEKVEKSLSKAKAAQARKGENDKYKSIGFLNDLWTFKWMTSPTSSLKIASAILFLQLSWSFLSPHAENPFTPFIYLSHVVPTSLVLAEDPGALLRGDHLLRYQKGWLDLCFLTYYIVVFSLIRQATTLYLFKPFAIWWGIKTQSKQERLMEQGYSFLYWGSAGLFGLYVMSFQDSWWFNLEHLWLRYPHWQMRPELKAYYLLQASYWLQQALVMILRLEKPRKDYYELIAHHLVTLWLIYWSYIINLTMIGTTVFVCMDIPDTWLAASKGINYLGLDKLATVTFLCFMFVWTYFRIYLSALTLWSVWFQFDSIPPHTKEWAPEKGWWMVGWMKYQVFAPLFILLCLNLFWYWLMWKILIRAVQGTVVSDVREEEDEDEDEIPAQVEGKKQK